MAGETDSSLPWEALKHTEGEIPWGTLETFANALAADESVFDRLTALYDAFMTAPHDDPTYEGLYVPAIFAMAAPRLTGALREKAAEFFVPP